MADANGMDRREFLTVALAAGAVAAAGGAAWAAQASSTTATDAAETIVFPQLPYPVNALAPFISARTVDLHYGQHHKSYYDAMTAFIRRRPEYRGKTVEELVSGVMSGTTLLDKTMVSSWLLFYNHNQYWPSMKPGGGGIPTKKDAFSAAVEANAGGFEGLRRKILEYSGMPGIGWIWVVREAGAVKVTRTEYNDSIDPVRQAPLLALDIWEHAYYLDYLNNRAAYVKNWLDHLVNWDHASQAFAAVK